MDKNTIMQIAKSDPQFTRIIDAIEQQIGNMPITPGDLDEAIKLLEFVLQNPDKYQEVVAAAVEDGVVGADEVPPEFDAVFIIAMLAAFYGLRERLESNEYKRGGLAKAARKLQKAGRGGDTMLAHINPREAEILRRMGGDGTINPTTGLVEYKSVGKIFRTILPIALQFIPGIGQIASTIGQAAGFSGTAAAVVGNAALQAGTAAVTGGDPLKAAIMGGISGGLGSAVGSGANKLLGLNLGTTGQNILGSALTGAGSAALTGGNVLQGALQGAGGQFLAGQLGQYGPNIGAGAQTSAQMLAAGYKPREAITGGVLSGLANKFVKPMFEKKPSDTVVDQIKQPLPGTDQSLAMFSPEGQTLLNQQAPQYDAQQLAALGYSPQEITAMNAPSGMPSTAPAPGAVAAPAAPAVAAAPAAPAGAAPKGPFGSIGNLAALSLLGSAMNNAPQPVQEAISDLSPEQREYFNRPSVTWDWNKLQRDANKANLSLSDFMSRYWPSITAGNYNLSTPLPGAPVANTGATIGVARGGALNSVARMARGAGSGRADTIDAKLSDGEYVMDAETVALLGDGSTDEGARRLDQMRQALRAHKGKSLAKGKFSPNAKSPLAYIKEIA